jgi:hypothetical protein
LPENALGSPSSIFPREVRIVEPTPRGIDESPLVGVELVGVDSSCARVNGGDDPVNGSKVEAR